MKDMNNSDKIHNFVIFMLTEIHPILMNLTENTLEKLKMIKKQTLLIKLICISLLFCYQNLISGSAGLNYTYDTQTIVSMPTAGLIPYNGQLLSLNFHSNTGMMFTIEYSPVTNASVGLSFGGNGIFGNETLKFQKYPGIEAKYRFINEKKYFPAIVVGFNSQGYGTYSDATEEFQVNSPGFFLAMSKSFKWDYGIYSIHLGSNYSLEQKSGNRKMNAYFGFEHTLGRQSSVNFEYDFNAPHNSGFNLMKGRTNLGIRYSIEKVTTLELKLIDIFGTQSEMLRFLKIEFVGFLF